MRCECYRSVRTADVLFRESFLFRCLLGVDDIETVTRWVSEKRYAGLCCSTDERQHRGKKPRHHVWDDHRTGTAVGTGVEIGVRIRWVPRRRSLQEGKPNSSCPILLTAVLSYVPYVIPSAPEGMTAAFAHAARKSRVPFQLAVNLTLEKTLQRGTICTTLKQSTGRRQPNSVHQMTILRPFLPCCCTVLQVSLGSLRPEQRQLHSSRERMANPKFKHIQTTALETMTVVREAAPKTLNISTDENYRLVFTHLALALFSSAPPGQQFDSAQSATARI